MSGSVTGTPNTMLRVEGLIAGAGAIAAYAALGASRWLFAALIFAPDLSMLGYVAGKRVGAVAYNLAHSYTLPGIVIGFGFFGSMPQAVALGLIWAAHIGLDRAMGYGLKYLEGFGVTHLGGKGRLARAAPDAAVTALA